MPSNNLDKYKYLTGKDLGLKPNTIELARFEYSSLGRTFNKGLDKDDKKEEFSKRLKMHKKTLLEMMIIKLFTTHLDQNLMTKMIYIKKINKITI